MNTIRIYLPTGETFDVILPDTIEYGEKSRVLDFLEDYCPNVEKWEWLEDIEGEHVFPRNLKGSIEIEIHPCMGDAFEVILPITLGRPLTDEAIFDFLDEHFINWDEYVLEV